MAKEYKGLKKEQKEHLKRAAAMYRTLTGEDVTGAVDSIPEYDPDAEKDAKEAEKRAKEELAAQAEATRKVEDARQAQRRAALAAQSGDDVQPGNPGPGQPAPITGRAKRQGKSRKGSEPATVTGREGSQNDAPGADEDESAGEENHA